MNGHTFDLDQIASTTLESSLVRLTFRNGDEIKLAWRDNSERAAVLRALDLPNAGADDQAIKQL